MEPTTVSRSQHRENHIRRKDLISSLAIGIAIGTVLGTPIGWFAHQLYAQQRAAQVLLCRQQHFGQTEASLQNICGSVY